MAHFKTEIKGNRGWVHRTGTKDSGMQAHVYGKNFGVMVEILHDHHNNKDFAHVYRTNGAVGEKTENQVEEFLFEITENEVLE